MVPDADLDTATRDVMIEHVLTQPRAHYVFPAVATRTEDAVRGSMRDGIYAGWDLCGMGSMRDGIYDAVPTEAALRALLTTQLQEVSGDKHLRLIYSAEALPERDNAYEDPTPPGSRKTARRAC